ncbi:MAG TPA: hypothetical protein VF731_05365 [Solirubrobacterales bacterium]
MTQLLFDLPGDLDLPVEVYDQCQRLVGRALSSGTVAVELGRYFVETRLPDGSRRQQTVEVDSEGEQEVFLGPAESTTHLVVPSQGIASSELLYAEEWPPIEDKMAGAWKETTEEAPPAWLAGFRWSSLGGWQVTARTPLYPWDLPASVWLGDGGWGALGLQRPDGHTTVIPIPGERKELLQFELHEEGEDLQLRAKLASEPAQALLNFLNLDLIGDAELLSHSRALQGEYLLRDKVADPLAAVAGAVALLRMNELDRLHDWTANLADWFPWLPDGTAVRAEHLALAGNHDEAVELLRELPTKGLPVLSTVLGFATDRMRTYSAYWPADGGLRHTLELLTSYALATDFSQPVTTFSGRDPDSPEGALPPDDRGADRGPEAVPREPATAGSTN